MTAPYAGRLQRARTLLEKSDADLLAVAVTDSLRHLSGLALVADERTSLLLVTADGAAFVVPSLNSEEAASIDPLARRYAWDDAEGPAAALAGAVAHLGGGVTRVAVDPEMWAGALLDLLGAIPGAEAVTAAPLLRTLRELKTAAEVEALRASAGTADAAMRAAIDACRPGVSELEVAGAAQAAFAAAGAEEVCFISVCSGPNSAFPHHDASVRELRSGEPVLIDLGGKREGYASDLTRTVHLGPPPDRYLEVHEIVERAAVAAIEVARPGATCAEVDDAARSVIAAAGYGELFVHRTGHGIGLSIHEAPWIMAGDDTPLAVGMLFSVEPGIYLPGEFGVRLEEIVHVGSNSTDRLSTLTRELKVAA